MNLIESFRIAWAALLANKLRAFLTMLGIIIGVGAVVGMLAIGNGYSDFIRREFDRLGVGVFYLTPTVDSQETGETIRPRLSASDAAAIMLPGAVANLESVALELDRSGTVSAGGERFRFGVKGVTPNYFGIGANELGQGRFFTDAEEQSRARVAVVGRRVAETLFGNLGNALGQRITINGVGFEVVGVTVTRQSQAAGAVGQFGDPGEQIYVPYNTAVSRLFRNSVNSRVDLSRITVKVRDVAAMNESISQVTQLLRNEHRLTYQPNDFRVTNPEEAVRQFQAITAGFSVFLGAIGGISLLVGGIGIMNIMLVSVTQRTREIGLRKAVGAKRRDIMAQFLIEAVVLCLVGGALGIGLGYLLSFGGTFLLNLISQDSNTRATVSLFSIVLATGVSVGIGVFFGLFPALRAAQLDPIRALRNE